MTFSREPVLILAAVHSIITLVAAFGLNLSGEQVAAINVAAGSVLALFARSKVSPVPT